MADARNESDDPGLAGVEDSLDPADLALVSRALESVSFLRPTPEPEPGATPMPPEVWERLRTALAEEAGATAPRSPRWLRWGGGLVAASVAVLAIGVAVTVFSGSSTDPVVVAESTAETATDDTEAAAKAAAAPAEGAAPEAAVAAASSDLSAPATVSFAGIVPPALQLLDTETDYTASDLGDQVTGVLSDLGMDAAAARSAMQQAPAEVAVPEPVDLLQSPRSLRDCITKLTSLATSTALLIDWATFEGSDAGVVVTPEYASTATGTMSLPDTSELDIWVIDDDCDVQMGMHIRMK